MSGALDYGRDIESMQRVSLFIHREAERCRWWQFRRLHRLNVTYWVHSRIMDDLIEAHRAVDCRPR